MDDQQKIIDEISRVFFFEYWARFYYAQEKEGIAHLEVPEDVLMECRREHPDLFPMLEKANHAMISFEDSQRQVGAFVMESMQLGKDQMDRILKVFDSKGFRIELHLFSMWIKGHETYLDEKRLDFTDWMDHYRNWRKMDQVLAFAAKLESTPDPAAGKTTTH